MDFGDLRFDLERCRELLEAESFEEAYELASDLLERAPRDGEVVSLFCEIALERGDAYEAVKACHRCLRGGAEGTVVLEWLARAQWELHLSEQCRSTCRRILLRDPLNETAMDYALSTVLELCDFEEAGDVIDRAAGLSDPDHHLAFQTAVARMMRGEVDWARGAFEEFLQADPSETSAYINLMRIHHLAGRYAEVEQVFDRALDQGLEHQDLYFNMGLTLKAEERDREAADCFIRAVRLAKDDGVELPDAYLALGQILRSEGHAKLALAMLQRELEIDDTQPAVHAEMAWCLEDEGDYEEAVRMIRAAVERAPDWGVYYHSLAELLLRADPSSPEAEGVARRAVELEPKHAAGWQVLGRLAADRGDAKAAREMLEKAVGAVDSTAEDEGWLGLFLFGAGRTEEALPHLEKAVRVFPYWVAAGEALGRARGVALLMRYEVVISGKDRSGAWYRSFHVVAESEKAAVAKVRERARRGSSTGRRESVRPLGYEVDQPAGVLWDSGRTRRPPRLAQEGV